MFGVYRNFLQSIVWNSIESILYHVLLLGHHVALFRILNHYQFGLIGLTFSAIYLIIALADMGLQASLPPFFKRLHVSKAIAKRVLFIQCLPTYILLITLCSIIYYFPHLIWLPSTITSTMLALMCCIILTEYTKKLTRSLLHLAFFNKQTALIELVTITTYTGTIWGLYWWGIPLTLNAILIPMFITSTASCFLLLYYLAQWYKKLPNLPSSYNQTNLSLFRSRLFTYGNQLGATLFSGNFLVPLMASYTSVGQAGVFKFISMIFHYISIVLHAIFGTSSSALFANSKNEPLDTKRTFFSNSTGHLYHAMCSIALFVTINYKTLFSLSSLGTFEYGIMFAILFMAIRMIENLLITYEKFYITEERAELLFFFNLFSMSIIYIIIYTTSIVSSFMSLATLLITMRLLTLLLISGYSFYIWKLKPLTKLHPFYFFSSLAVSLLFFMVSHLIVL